MIVMAVTGVMLWAKVLVGNHMPRWWLDVATAIHFYEAVLATLAIIVWHFYQVFFDPDVYPDELGVVGWKDDAAPLSRRARARHRTAIVGSTDEAIQAEHCRARSRSRQGSNMDTENTPPPPAEPWHRSRMLLRNPISLAGMALAIVSLANIFLFVLIDAIATKASPYIGILAYMVSPAFLVLGLLLMLAGVLIERRKKVAPTAFYPRIDLNDRTQRSAVISFATFLIVFVMVSTAGSYKAYEFTESVAFCGQLCHTVMSPEYTAYQLSPHARVACAECHVGAGATWFVKSKLSGSRQVFAAIFNTFPRPDSDARAQLAPGAGNLRAVPLAEEVLRRAAESLHALRQRRKEHHAPDPHDHQDRRRRSRHRRARRHSLAHEHRQQDRLRGRR